MPPGATTLRFHKMEGTGNDYVFVDAIAQAFPLARGAELARRWSDRHFGIGADGLIAMVAAASPAAAVGMAMWNADGSVGAMCGNGLRCLARLARECGHVDTDAFTVATTAGPRRVELVRAASGDVASVRADLGAVRAATTPLRVRAADCELDLYPGDAGNPHAVALLDGDPEAFPVAAVGAALQAHPAFPGGVNVEFVQVQADGSLRQRTFERGSGETLACGTGATVAALAARAAGLVTGETIVVELRGGPLRVVGTGAALAIEGPGRTVFAGEIGIAE